MNGDGALAPFRSHSSLMHKYKTQNVYLLISILSSVILLRRLKAVTL